MDQKQVIGGFPDVTYVEWEIPDFLSIQMDEEESFESPAFESAGSTFKLIVYPKNDNGKAGFVSVTLCNVTRMSDPEAVVKKSFFIIGIKRDDGNLEERLKRNLDDRGRFFWNGLVDRAELKKRKSQLLPSGKLTITFRMQVEEPTVTKQADPNPKQVSPDPSPKGYTNQLVALEALSSDFKDLLASERKCDITVNVQGRDFRVHRAVLLARSSMLDEEVHDEEAQSGVLKITDCDSESFADFLGYLYTGKTGEMTFRTACHLLITSHKYSVQQLQSFCSDYLSQNLDSENVCSAALLAYEYCDDKLMSSAQEFFNKNFPSILMTSEWADMLKNHHCLANKLLTEMASATLKMQSQKKSQSAQRRLADREPGTSKRMRTKPSR